jgi:hypothetical protein
VDDIIAVGQPWQDSEFPPSAESLGNKKGLEKVDWKRISEIYKDA